MCHTTVLKRDIIHFVFAEIPINYHKLQKMLKIPKTAKTTQNTRINVQEMLRGFSFCLPVANKCNVSKLKWVAEKNGWQNVNIQL